MYTVKDTESELSVAYLQAIAARNRFSCTIATRTMDNNGIDATLHGMDDFGGSLTEITLHVQLKATIKEPLIQDGKIRFLQSHYLFSLTPACCDTNNFYI